MAAFSLNNMHHVNVWLTPVKYIYFFLTFDNCVVKPKWTPVVPYEYALKSFLYQHDVLLMYTMYNVILCIARNLLEKREDIKYLTHPFYCTNLDWKRPIFQNGHISKSPILKKFSQKKHRLVLGLVGLIDGKCIVVAQPTRCKSRNLTYFQIKILKEPLLVMKQTIPQQKALDFSF